MHFYCLHHYYYNVVYTIIKFNKDIISMYYHVSLDNNHRIAIPSQIRKKVKLQKGDSLVMTLINNEIHLNSIDTKIADAQNLVQQYCVDKNLVDDLITTKIETKPSTENKTDTEEKVNIEKISQHETNNDQ